MTPTLYPLDREYVLIHPCKAYPHPGTTDATALGIVCTQECLHRARDLELSRDGSQLLAAWGYSDMESLSLTEMEAGLAKAATEREAELEGE
eukprot:3244391-Rhodomonas_salina.2